MITARLVAIGAAILLVVGLLLWGPAACQRIRSLTAQSKVTQGQTDALRNSATDAVNTQSETNKRETGSEALTRSNEKEIRDAEGANDPVNPAARDAGLRALCRRAAYRDDPKCRMLQSNPR